MAEKQLQSTLAAAAFQKQWFAELRRRVFDERRPYALVQADVPFELFDLLEIPAVSNQWWASLVAAKRQAPAFLDAMTADGVPDGSAAIAASGSPRRATPKPARPVGRAAEAAPALRATDLRLHPSRLLALGRSLRRRALRDRQPGRERAAAALVGAEPASLARARRAASARSSSRRRSSVSSNGSRRSADGVSTAQRCASVSSASTGRKRSSTRRGG